MHLVSPQFLLCKHPLLLTLAISSVFLTSPSIRITSPFSSTSVQRSLGSNAALAARVLRVLNMELVSPTSSWLGKSSDLSGLVHLPRVAPSSLSRQFNLGDGLASLSSENLSCLVLVVPKNPTEPSRKSFLRCRTLVAIASAPNRDDCSVFSGFANIGFGRGATLTFLFAAHGMR
jgi:hypothetical protein